MFSVCNGYRPKTVHSAKKKLFKARRLISTHAFILIFGCKNTTIDKEECIAKTVSNPISTRDSITNVSPRAYKRPAG